MQRAVAIEIDAPAEVVWGYLAERAEELDPAIERFEVEGEPGVGARNRITFRGPLGIRLKAVSLIEEWEPPHRYAVRSVKPAWPVRSRVVDEIDALDDGVRYTVTITVEPARFARPLAGLWLRFVVRTREQLMERLKAAVETGW